MRIATTCTGPNVFAFCLALLAFFKLNAQAPEPPLPVEMLFGNDQFYFQVVIKKKFSPDSKFGFFSVATYSASYNQKIPQNSITIPAQFSYSLGKGFGIMAGMEINSVAGFSPIVGPQHNYTSKKVLAVTVASLFLNEDLDFKLFGLYEYKPPLNEKWTWYNRLQFIYNHNLKEGIHNRSYLYLRSGLKRKSLAFGLGANLDQIGPNKIFADNYGLFARWDFN
ncbi:MAG: hypothetical protein SFV55_27590 [Haliscomenobacter sp.]|uniref:hypothetical protein n=1 Tax=Haliscomenobacter sp. TaxID=2717303 RepID=UPI0029B7AA78|nr:hypothetical protein [Haliscomenobacter sp.]MDX2072228.1 hypothetical protein [Haliscomenobacter sp.]